jgi:hypothetical protein
LSSSLLVEPSKPFVDLSLREIQSTMNENDVRPYVDSFFEHENDSEEDEEEDDEEAVDEENPGDDDEDEPRRLHRLYILSMRIREICERFFDVDMEHPLCLKSTDGAVLQKQFEGYRPKDGDYNNLQLFVEKLDFVDDNFLPLLVWLPNNEGVCVLRWYVPGLNWRNVEIVCGRKSYVAGLHTVSSAMPGGILLSVYLLQGRDSIDADCVLKSITELAIARQASGNDSMLCLTEPEEEDEDEGVPLRAVQNFFTNAAWQRSLMSLSACQIRVQLAHVSLSDELWVGRAVGRATECAMHFLDDEHSHADFLCAVR